MVLTPVAKACRYSVRDVGFADLGNERYKLRCFVDDLENGGSADPLGQASRTLLSDSNVAFELAKRDSGEQRLALVSPDGKRTHTIAWPTRTQRWNR